MSVRRFGAVKGKSWRSDGGQEMLGKSNGTKLMVAEEDLRNLTGMAREDQCKSSVINVKVWG